MLDGIATISLCRMLAGPSTLGRSMPSRECFMRLFVEILLRSLPRTTTPDVNTLGLAESDQQLLPQFVQTAKQNVGPPFFVCLRNSHNDRTSIPCCLLEVGEVLNTSPRPLPLRRIVLPLLRQFWRPSRSTGLMELILSTFAFESFGSPACSSKPQLGAPRKAGNWLQHRVGERYCQLPFLPTDAPLHERIKSYNIRCGLYKALRRPRR